MSTLLALWLQFEGRHIRVDRAAAVSKGIEGGGTQILYDSARSLFVGNLPFDTKASTASKFLRLEITIAAAPIHLYA